MKKTRKPYKQRKRFTIMLVPDSSAKVRRINIPYWAFTFLAIPFLCIIIILYMFYVSATDFAGRAGRYEDQIKNTSQMLDEVIVENGELTERLISTEYMLEQSKQEAEALRAQLDNHLNDYEHRLAELYIKIDTIDDIKRNILDVFEDLQELNIPIAFDETLLSELDNGIASETNTGAASDVFPALNAALSGNILEMQELEAFTEALSSYFNARPTGSPIPGRAPGRGYGYSISPTTGEYGLHEGVDIFAVLDEEIYATADGVVSFSGWNNGGYGFLVIIEHAYGYSTYYSHNSQNLVAAGEEVTRGQLIALAGSTGDSEGVHCHYEVRINGVAQDPDPYIRN